MNSKFGIIATVVSIACASQPATAASFSTATLGPIKVTLLDLNPTDSILPSITWSNNNNYANHTYAYVYDQNSGSSQGNGQYGAQVGSNNSQSYHLGQSYATAAITSGGNDSSLDQASLAAAGYTNGANTPYSFPSNYSASTSVPNYYYWSQSFTLSAYTGVIFSAEVYTSATTTVGYQDGWGSEHAQASASLSVSGSSPTSINGSQSSGDSQTVYANYSVNYTWNPISGNYDYDYQGQTNSINRTLSAAFTNFSNDNKDAYFSASTSVYGYSYVASVPEADTSALMLAGMGLIGVVTRRRLK